MALELGHLVAYLRENLPLREEQAAYRAWVTPEYWRAIENGKRLPSLAVFIMLARALGLDPRELLDQLLERMHYGRGAPPVIQPSPRGASGIDSQERLAANTGSPRAALGPSERLMSRKENPRPRIAQDGAKARR